MNKNLDVNAGWVYNALEIAIEKYGAPKHIISDQASVFTGGVFAELLRQWNVKPRFGAVEKTRINLCHGKSHQDPEIRMAETNPDH
jgi:hypothetical protein